jgi:hypothetical protein
MAMPIAVPVRIRRAVMQLMVCAKVIAFAISH